MAARKPDPPTRYDAQDEESMPSANPRTSASTFAEAHKERTTTNPKPRCLGPHARIVAVLVLIWLAVGGGLTVYLRTGRRKKDKDNSGASAAGTDGSPPMPSSNVAPFPSDCPEPDAKYCHIPQTTRRGTHCGLDYEVFGSADELTGIGFSCMTNTPTGFQSSWRPLDGNYLARKGLHPGSKNQRIEFRADYRPGDGENGFSLMGAYGWIRDPLVEYYVVESWGGIRPPAIPIRLPLGEVQADGGTYDLFATLRVDKPSIDGIQTFPQLWSVRQEPRTTGTITLSKHFAAWEPQGYAIGRLYEVAFVTEGFNNFGTADVSLRFSKEED